MSDLFQQRPGCDVGGERSGGDGFDNQEDRRVINDSLLTAGASGKDELFSQEKEQRPWWKAQFLENSPVLFGAWDGVFTSVVVNIFGVIALLRSGWLVGEAGIVLTLSIILASVAVVTTSVLSAIGISERCAMKGGGVYLLVSRVLGSHLGTSIGLIYCFGQAVGCALCAAAFGESIVDLMDVGEIAWLQRTVGIILIALLTAINLAGVHWVIKIQFVLLAFLATAVADFLVGSFINHRTEDSGFVGWNWQNLVQNSVARFTDGNNWFTVFGVFFPSLTGIMAGLNMSGDLKDPHRDIPRGTMVALGTCTGLYVVFTFVLAATCSREALLTDYIIAERVAATGVFILLGLYISSISSCLATLYGTPRVLQSIANENIIQVLAPLGKGRGANQMPVNALLCLSAASLLFILIGQVNRLAPMVTMPFLMTYACIDYAYFALASTHDTQSVQTAARQDEVGIFDTSQSKGAHMYGSTEYREKHTNVKQVPAENDSVSLYCGTQHLQPSQIQVGNDDEDMRIGRQPYSWYSRFCNRWISLLGSLAKLVIMLLVNWLYCAVTVIVLVAIWLYGRSATPGCPLGLASEFSLIDWLMTLARQLSGREKKAKLGANHVIMTPAAPEVIMESTQVTAENSDFQHRSKYHYSTMNSTPLLP